MRDTCVGMPPEMLPHVFDRFYRRESTRATQGTGLGLSIVERLVEIQGGSVHAESAEGEGTTLPVAFDVAPGAPAGMASGGVAGHAPS